MPRQLRLPSPHRRRSWLVAPVLGLGLLAVTAHSVAAAPEPPGTLDESAPDQSTLEPAAPAAEPPLPEWAVEPSGEYGTGYRDAFAYTLAPGQSLDDVVAVSNYGDEPMTLQIYATDALNTLDGGLTLLPGDQPATDVGSWIEPLVDEQTVGPGQRVDIPFTLTVPDDASPGDHVGGIVAARRVAAGEGDGINVDLEQRVGARIYLRVDGPTAPGLTIEDVRIGYDTPATPLGTSPMTVTYRVRNTGNIRLAPTVTMQLEGPFGRGDRGPYPQELLEVLPGNAVEVVQEVADVRPLGRLQAGFALTADADQPVSSERTVTVWAIPWPSVVAVLGVLVLLAVWRGVRRRGAARRARRDEPWDDEPWDDGPWDDEPWDDDDDVDVDGDEDEIDVHGADGADGAGAVGARRRLES